MAKSSAQSDSNMLPRWACHICFEEAKSDPVLTSCGHLFCWPCLYSWMRNMRKPCPVCRTTVTNILPVYGSAESKPSSSSAPPRPRPITRPALLPPVQLNTAPGLPRNDIHVDMQRVPSRGRATMTVRQVEAAAAREHAAREMAQFTENLASAQENDHNVSRMCRKLEEMRAMSPSEAPHSSRN